MNKKIIAFDLISGEKEITESLEASKIFLKENKEYQIIGFINENSKIKEYINIDRLSFIKTNQVILQSDGPLEIRKKINSSLIQSIKYVIDGKADIIISAASSGLLVMAGYLFSKPINNLYKPAFAAIGKSINGKNKIFLDVGANIDVNPETLEKYALMGSSFSKAMNFSNNPIVRLLNIGIEENKGNDLLKKTFILLKKNKNINFKGNLEPNEVLLDGEDVVLSDSMSGNIYVKSYEGAFKLVYDVIKKSAKQSFETKLGLLLSWKMRENLKKAMNSELEGGAIILGLNHLIIKVHGSSNQKQFFNSLNLSKKINESNSLEKIKENFKI